MNHAKAIRCVLALHLLLPIVLLVVSQFVGSARAQGAPEAACDANATPAARQQPPDVMPH